MRIRTLTSVAAIRPRSGRAEPAPRLRLLGFVALEAFVWAACYGLYLVVRGFSIGSEAEAMRHAAEVIDLERTIGAFHEASIQQALRPLAEVFSTYYMVGFGPLLAGMLVWLACRDRALYRQMRTALLVSLAIATVVFVLYPTAPPRLVEGIGIADTVGLTGHDNGSFLGIRFNPYAAMPSMHVGWSLIAGLYGYRAARTRVVRLFFAVHPAFMALTVVVTGNHYIVDALAGIAVVAAALLLLARHRPPRELESGAPRGLRDSGPQAV